MSEEAWSLGRVVRGAGQLQGPLAGGVLAPVVHGEERPVLETCGHLVLGTRQQQRRSGGLGSLVVSKILGNAEISIDQ